MNDTDKRYSAEAAKTPRSSSIYTLFTPRDFAELASLALSPSHSAASIANRILAERATRVWICAHANGTRTAHLAEPVDATHMGALFGVEPIVRDTAESVLREIVRLAKECDGITANAPILERAECVLAAPTAAYESQRDVSGDDTLGIEYTRAKQQEGEA